MWTLTPYGVQFLTLKVQVPTYVVTRWCSEHIGFSGMLIDARTAVEHRNKFSYAELMKGPFLPPQAGGS